MTAPSLITGLGGPAGFGTESLGPNDDLFEPFFDITPVFENGLTWFGITYSTLSVSNNGTVTFDGTFPGFDPEPQSQFVAAGFYPFWADVDTRMDDFGPIDDVPPPDDGSGGRPLEVLPGDGISEPAPRLAPVLAPVLAPGLEPSPGTSKGTDNVWYAIDTVNDRVVVTWDDVGYFSLGKDRKNAFQLVIEDTSDEDGRSEGDFDFTFIYEDIQWTTGDASGGARGLDDGDGNVAAAGYSDGILGEPFSVLPQSGDEAALLDLEVTEGNTGQDGIWTFEVRDGVVTNPLEPFDTVDLGGVFLGTRGRDNLFGTSFADEMNGRGNNDVIDGFGGDDSILGGGGNDLVFGGSGDDDIAGGGGNDELYGDDDNDVLKGVNGDDSLFGGFGNDRLIGGNGADLLDGGEDRDIIIAGRGADTVLLSEGNDVIRLGLGNNIDADADTLVYNSFADTDKVFGFDVALDQIDLFGADYTTQSVGRGQHTRIDFEFGGSVILRDVTEADLLAAADDVFI